MQAEWMPYFFESSFLIVLTDFIAINICTNEYLNKFKCARNRIQHSSVEYINRWIQSPKSDFNYVNVIRCALHALETQYEECATD